MESILDTPTSDLTLNRGFLYGDALFETMRIHKGKILYWEDHYFRLMASMRLLRMRIPMDFTMESLEEMVLSKLKNDESKSARVRMTIYRNGHGLYTPERRDVAYVIQVDATTLSDLYQWNSGEYEVELYKDFYVSNQLLSNLKTTNRLVNVLGGIYAQENEFSSCILINESKNVSELLNGNIFMRKGNEVITPSLDQGCIQGVMRKQILRILQNTDKYTITEGVISTFDLQKADELFYTNVIQGVQSITKYRKKTYETSLAQLLNSEINKELI